MEITTQRIYDAAVAVLGSVMIKPTVAGDVFAKVRAEHFIMPEYRTVFEAEQSLFLSGKAIDPVAVTAIIGEAYRPLIMDIMDLTPTAANCMVYVDLLIEQTRLHRLRELGTRLANAATLDDATDLLEQGQGLYANSSGMTALSLKDGYIGFVERQNQETHYLNFGMEGLDSRVFAELGDYILLGARPSTGKTMLALQLAVHLSKTYRVGFFSLETKDEKLIDRTMAHVFSVSFRKIKKHSLSQVDWQLMARQTERLTNSNLEVVQATGRTAEEIASFARYRRYEIILIDYIQLVRTSKKAYSRENEVASISTALANFARAHGVTVIALAQLTRDNEDAKKKTVRAPTLASFRESGALEQDADIALLMYLSEPDNKNSDRILRLAKNKEGGLGKLQLAFHGDTQTFTERIAVQGDPFGWRNPAPPVDRSSLEPKEWQDITANEQIPFPEFGGKTHGA